MENPTPGAPAPLAQSADETPSPKPNEGFRLRGLVNNNLAPAEADSPVKPKTEGLKVDVLINGQ